MSRLDARLGLLRPRFCDLHAPFRTGLGCLRPLFDCLDTRFGCFGAILCGFQFSAHALHKILNAGFLLLDAKFALPDHLGGLTDEIERRRPILLGGPARGAGRLGRRLLQRGPQVRQLVEIHGRVSQVSAAGFGAS